MEVYVLRHGIAVPHGTPNYKENDRPLTEAGRKKMIRAARGIKKIVSGFDVLLTSPLKRAYDTALIVARAMVPEINIQIYEPLLPGTPLNDLMNGLARFNKENRILIVGHEPELGYFASALIGVQGAVLEFRKGSFCRIEISGFPPEKPGVLKWHLRPNQLRLLAARAS